MCVSTTYGSGDWGRTPHGAIIAGAAFGKLPFVMSGIELEAVGVDDAARAMILAAERGRIGERYLISEKMISNAEVARIAAEAAGVAPPAKAIPLPMSYALAAMGTLKARLRRTDGGSSLDSLRLMRAEGPLDHGKAVRSWAGSRGRSRSPSERPPGPGSGCAPRRSRRRRHQNEPACPSFRVRAMTRLIALAFATLLSRDRLLVGNHHHSVPGEPLGCVLHQAASATATAAGPKITIADMKFSAPLTVAPVPP